RPQGLIIPGEVRPEQVAYFLVKEQARRLRDLCLRAEDRVVAPGKKLISRARGRSLAAGQLTLRQVSARDLWNEIIAPQAVGGFWGNLVSVPTAFGERVEDYLAEVIREASLLQAIAPGDGETEADRVVMFIRSPDESRVDEPALLGKLYKKLFKNQLGMEVET